MKYAELDERAKERARQWFADTERELWDGSDCYEEITTVMRFLGFVYSTKTVALRSGKTCEEPNFRWQISWGQGDYFSFSGSWQARYMNIAGLRAFAPQDNVLQQLGVQMMVLFLKHPEAMGIISHAGLESSYSSAEDPDESLDDDSEHQLRDLVRKFNHWAYCYLRDDLEYRLEDEQVVDGIEANEYDFDEEGQPA